EVWQPLQHVWFNRLHGEQRHQAHKRTDLQSPELAEREVQHVIEELVFFVPEWHAHAANVVERCGDIQEMLEELARDVFVRTTLPRQLQGDGQHVEAVHAHRGRAVRLTEVSAGG